MRSVTICPGWTTAGSSGSGSVVPSVPVTIPMPRGVALTTRSAAATSASPPTRPRSPARVAVRAAGSGDRFTIATSLAPASPRARATARPAPPAPSTTQRSPVTSMPSSVRSASTKPAPSVLSPSSRSPCQYTQLTAPSAAATGVRSSTASCAAALWGMVTDNPPMPSSRRAPIAAAIPGRQELVVVGREEVRAVVGLGVEHVVEPVAVGRVQRGLDARPPRRGDGRRRQALPVAGVVGRIQRQVVLGQRAAGLTLGEAAGGVDLQRHLLLQPVVDHPGDARPVLVGPRLLLDQRRQGQKLVGRQAQLFGPRLDVQLRQRAVELRHHPLDDHRLGVPLLHLVALGEEGALERRLVRRQDRRP